MAQFETQLRQAFIRGAVKAAQHPTKENRSLIFRVAANADDKVGVYNPHVNVQRKTLAMQ